MSVACKQLSAAKWFVFLCWSVWVRLVFPGPIGHLQQQQQHQVGAQVAGAQLQALNATTTSPYWRRPGCYQVGHTRTISIPGCVKFNLSTNACRGFCMSFSIPAAEDIGPDLIGGDVDDADLMGALIEAKDIASHLSKASPLLVERLQRHHQQADRMATGEAKRAASGGHLRPRSSLGGATSSPLDMEKRQDFVHLSSANKSPLDGAFGDSSASDKRDVVSVGQCCNMMETEDVTVNLRCGLNETRKLVFKSAKTCECFFCKHV